MFARVIILFVLLTACASCEEYGITFSKRKVRTHTTEIDIGSAYWSNASPILSTEWQLVVGGTVTELHTRDGFGAHPDPFSCGTLSVEKIFLNLPTEKDVVSAELKTLKGELFDGLKVGDKVIVFITEYDGGFAMIEVADSNCKMGVKVNAWDDAIVKEVEKMTRDAQVVNDFGARLKMLEDPAIEKLWLPFSKDGIAALRERKSVADEPSPIQ